MAAPARPQKATTTPAAAARKPRRTAHGASAPAVATDINFSDNTGKTHGIRLRINPPSTAKARMVHSGRQSRVAVADPAVRRFSTKRSPSTAVTRNAAPTTGARPWTVSGKVNVAVRRSLSKRRSGAPKVTPSGPSGNTSGLTRGASALSRTRNRSGGAPMASTAVTRRPAPERSPGTRARTRSINCAKADGAAAPAGRSRLRSASSGRQISLHIKPRIRARNDSGAPGRAMARRSG